MNFDIPQDLADYLLELDDFIERVITHKSEIKSTNRELHGYG